MPISSCVLKELKLVQIFLTGSIEEGELERVVSSLPELEGFEPELNSIAVLSQGIDLSPVSSCSVKRAASNARLFSESSRHVLLAMDDLGYGLARVFAHRREECGTAEYVVTRSLSEACRVLDLSPAELCNSAPGAFEAFSELVEVD